MYLPHSNAVPWSLSKHHQPKLVRIIFRIKVLWVKFFIIDKVIVVSWDATNINLDIPSFWHNKASFWNLVILGVHLHSWLIMRLFNMKGSEMTMSMNMSSWTLSMVISPLAPKTSSISCTTFSWTSTLSASLLQMMASPGLWFQSQLKRRALAIKAFQCQGQCPWCQLYQWLHIFQTHSQRCLVVLGSC